MRGGISMKKYLMIMVTVAFLVTSASAAGAWEVKIKNSCNIDVTIWVKGEHLFWRSVDCEVKVGKGTTGTCQLPGAICPTDILGYYTYDKSPYDLNTVHCTNAEAQVCCCWNVNVEVIQYGEKSCRLQLR
jgi:hypothetical protein